MCTATFLHAFKLAVSTKAHKAAPGQTVGRSPCHSMYMRQENQPHTPGNLGHGTCNTATGRQPVFMARLTNGRNGGSRNSNKARI